MMPFYGYLVRYDELALKGKNRGRFEQQLVSNIQDKLKSYAVTVERLWGRIMVKGRRDDKIGDALKKIFGLSSFSPVFGAASSLEAIQEAGVRLVVNAIEHRGNTPRRFRVTTRRVDKQFQLISPEINKVVAGAILKKLPMLVVDLKRPELELGIEIRKETAFLYLEKIEGLKGLPVGSGGSVLTLLSGGIDSPVAAWLMMKRGCAVNFIHFFSYPYTGVQSKEKVLDLVKELTRYQKRSTLYVVSFTDVQEEIRRCCKERFRTLLYRRFMQRIASRVAREHRMAALVSGESLGQVASQTLENISAISQSTELLVVRPLIAFNKQETIQLAKSIGTYEISIRPYDDCCSLFQSKSPATRSKAGDLLREEERLDVDALVEDAVTAVETIHL